MQKLVTYTTGFLRTSGVSHINSGNHERHVPTSSDIVVAGGSIHALIYAIHVMSKHSAVCGSDSGVAPRNPPSITVFEKADSPGYKIGESTLTVFGLWLKTVGIGSALLWRLFGPKDGLAFYYLHPDHPDEVGKFCANGPPGDFVPTLQIERKVSELLLTLYAQRLGINVFHGHEVNIDETHLPGNAGAPVQVKATDGLKDYSINSSLLIDATGRFRRISSKTSRKEQLPGFNTEAYWAYFDFNGSDSDVDFPHYETCNTNHICIPEGWAWVIRLPSWEGSPLPSLIAMINHLLDLNARDTHHDDFPSSEELAKTFGLKFRWVVSIGYALRDDVEYPLDISTYGSCEAERKFNWITSRYARMGQLMSKHKLIRDLYGPKTTWFVRKGLTYRAPVVSGPGWAAIGDATGFTNPLYSPGINCNMATDIKLAEMTHSYLTSIDRQDRAQLMEDYQRFCADRVTNLDRMNRFNYLAMRSPQTGPLGPLWQYLTGTGNVGWQRMKSYTLDTVAEILTTWEWGSNEEDFINFATRAIDLLDGPPMCLEPEAITKTLDLSDKMVKATLASGKYRGRWAGLLRWYDDQLEYCPGKTARDVLARKCESCDNWRILVGDDVRKCATCGAKNSQNAIIRYCC